jgi:hypothetical protein
MKRVLISKEYKHLQEELIPANSKNLKLLEQNMKKDPALNRRLTEPAINNPYYRFLVEEIAPRIRKFSLLYIIELTIKDSDKHGFTSYFCKSGMVITAFVAYIDNGNIIEEVKIFSLLDQNQPNPVLAKDLIKFLHENLKTHSMIKWETMKENPAVEQYNKVSKMFGLDISRNNKEIKHPTNNNLFRYVLKKENYTPNLQKLVERYLKS